MELIAPEFLARATITARTPFDLDSLQGVWNAVLCSDLNFKLIHSSLSSCLCTTISKTLVNKLKVLLENWKLTLTTPSFLCSTSSINQPNRSSSSLRLELL